MATAGTSKNLLLVAGSFLALSIIFSARATLGLAMPHVEAEMGWTRSFMSAVMSATLVFMAVMAPVAGRLLDRIGPRIVLLVGTVSVVVGSVVLAALATQPWIRGWVRRLQRPRFRSGRQFHRRRNHRSYIY